MQGTAGAAVHLAGPQVCPVPRPPDTAGGPTPGHQQGRDGQLSPTPGYRASRHLKTGLPEPPIVDISGSGQIPAPATLIKQVKFT